MKLDLTEAAIEDLRSIRAYTLQRWGEQQEQVYIDRLWDRFGELLKDCSPYRFRHDLFPGCQLAAEGKHVILFRIRGEVLEVIRVLHSAMDFKRHLGRD
jgi:toxin ParE1/3/4